MSDKYGSETNDSNEMTELKKTEPQYNQIIQTSIDGFWVNDINGLFLDVNNAYCDLTGYSREELLNMRVSDLDAGEKPEETAAHIRKIMEIGSDRFVTRHICKSGNIIDIEISVNYLNGPIGSFFVFVRNITDQLRVENELFLEDESYRTIIENSPS